MVGKNWIVAGAVLVSLAVALSAFGAHGVPAYLREANYIDAEKRLLRWLTATEFHLVHGIGLILLGLIKAICHHGRYLKMTKIMLAVFDVAGILMSVGMLFFCGLLYVTSLTLFDAGFFVPLGGVCLILSWLIFAIGVFSLPRREKDAGSILSQE